MSSGNVGTGSGSVRSGPLASSPPAVASRAAQVVSGASDSNVGDNLFAGGGRGISSGGNVAANPVGSVPTVAPGNGGGGFGAAGLGQSAGGSAGGSAHGVVGEDGLSRSVQVVGTGWGRGPIPPDPRRHRFDVTRAMSRPALAVSVSRVDRMDPGEAGDLLFLIHQHMKIAQQNPERILGFNRALWLQHALNGASLAQPGRGKIIVDQVEFDIEGIKNHLGVNMRRFFRTYADDVVEALKWTLESYDPYDHNSADLHGQIQQIAMERGLQKYPYLIHDSADACVNLSFDERAAVIVSKRRVLADRGNVVDAPV